MLVLIRLVLNMLVLSLLVLSMLVPSMLVLSMLVPITLVPITLDSGVALPDRSTSDPQNYSHKNDCKHNCGDLQASGGFLVHLALLLWSLGFTCGNFRRIRGYCLCVCDSLMRSVF